MGGILILVNGLSSKKPSGLFLEAPLKHRYNLMQHMPQENVSLITVCRAECRELEEANNSSHFFCADGLSVLHSASAKEGNFVFPLWLYPRKKQDLFDDDQRQLT